MQNIHFQFIFGNENLMDIRILFISSMDVYMDLELVLIQNGNQKKTTLRINNLQIINIYHMKKKLQYQNGLSKVIRKILLQVHLIKILNLILVSSSVLHFSLFLSQMVLYDQLLIYHIHLVHYFVL